MRARVWVGLLFLLLSAGLAACFLYGPLFPWSPWRPGYRTWSTNRALVVYPRGTILSDPYDSVDSHIAGAEKFLTLQALNRITVILCKDWSDFERMMPHMRSRGLGGVTLATGTVIYITPKLDEKRFSHTEFLRHELTHAVMHQNQTIRNALALGKVEWISEGLPVSYGDQTSYLSRKEFLERAAKEELAPVIDPDLRIKDKFDIRFAYPAWRYFTEYLTAKKGPALFYNYVIAAMRHPENWRPLFEQILEQKFGDAIDEFQRSVRKQQ